MAIAVSCPKCDREMKVKDELAGRKIKCPDCGKTIEVLEQTDDEESRVSAKKGSKARDLDEEDDEEPEEEERPRKKKKKKKKKSSNTGLLIGGGVGVLAIVALLLFVFWPKSDAKTPPIAAKKPAPAPVEEPKVEQPAPKADELPKKGPATGIARSRERTEIEGALRQLGLAFTSYCDGNNGKGPKTQKDLAPSYENNAYINEMFDTKWLTFMWGAGNNSFPDGRSNTILAYETIADGQGNRFCLLGDGSVQTLSEVEFLKMPKAK